MRRGTKPVWEGRPLRRVEVQKAPLGAAGGAWGWLVCRLTRLVSWAMLHHYRHENRRAIVCLIQKYFANA